MLADAYRRTMNRGDLELGKDSLDQGILQAILASSAADTAHWIQTRIQGGDVVAQPLLDLVPLLEKDNRIGQGLEYARSAAVKEAKELVTSAVTGSTRPLKVGAVVTLLLGVFGFLQDSGASVASALAPFIFGGGTLLVILLRASWAAATKLGGVGQGLWSRATTVGASAQRLFQAETGPALLAVLGAAVVGPPVPGPAGPGLRTPVVGELRAIGRSGVLLAGAFLAAAVIFFLIGAASGFNSYLNPPCVDSLELGLCR